MRALPVTALLLATAAIAISGFSTYQLMYSRDLLKCQSVWQQRFAVASAYPKSADPVVRRVMMTEIIHDHPGPRYWGRDICNDQ